MTFYNVILSEGGGIIQESPNTA